MNRRVSVLLFSIVSFISAAVLPVHASTLMTRHVREATVNGEARVVGRLPQTQIMLLDVVLPLRDSAGLDEFLADLYSSTVPNYRHYVTPVEFTERFGPTREQHDAVVRYVQENGLEVVGGSRDGMEVQVRGTVAAIELAFHMNLLTTSIPPRIELSTGRTGSRLRTYRSRYGTSQDSTIFRFRIHCTWARGTTRKHTAFLVRPWFATPPLDLVHRRHS